MTALRSQVLQVQAFPALLGKTLRCFAVLGGSSDLRRLPLFGLVSLPSLQIMSLRDTTIGNVAVHGTSNNIKLRHSAADMAALVGHQLLAATRMSQMTTR